ncbi:MAG: hypothetical protein ABIV48_03425 [Pyrinomonadaceae bacterium]
MNIRDALLAEHSKSQTMKIVRYIDGDAVRFKELMDYFLGDNYRLSQRAAWAVNYCAEYRNESVKPYFGKLAEQFERTDVHPAVLRNVARMLQFVDIPKRFHGRVFDSCYKLVDDAGQSLAVRVFALTVAARIANGEPVLLDELRLLAEKHAPHTTIAFRVRARRVLGVK